MAKKMVLVPIVSAEDLKVGNYVKSKNSVRKILKIEPTECECKWHFTVSKRVDMVDFENGKSPKDWEQKTQPSEFAKYPEFSVPNFLYTITDFTYWKSKKITFVDA